MKDFLKQLDAYSNDKLDQIMPTMQMHNITFTNQ